MGKNNGGHQERSRKFMGKLRTAEWWPRSDRGQAGRSNFFKLRPAAGGQVVVLSFAGGLTLSAANYPPPNCGLERTSRFRRWHRPSKDLVSGVWRFFFFVRTTIVASLDGQQDVQCSKVHLLAEKSWTVDDMQGPWASPSNVRGLRPGRPHNLPQVRFLSLQVFVT